mmetsp:Transcript_110548/g.311778  ORF Transcript_110548/g.311778 Transcript_110548/m.311778 type:complete len:176 (-) Transcript_110548:75-602(-)
MAIVRCGAARARRSRIARRRRASAGVGWRHHATIPARRFKDALQKHGMLVPHRFNAFPAMQDFPPQLRRRLRESSPKYEAHLQLFSPGGGIREVQLEKSVDHCCLAGRLHACTQFWWTCEHCNSVFPSLAAVKLSARGLPVLLASHGGLEFCGVCQAGVGRRCPCASTGTLEINR